MRARLSALSRTCSYRAARFALRAVVGARELDTFLADKDVVAGELGRHRSPAAAEANLSRRRRRFMNVVADYLVRSAAVGGSSTQLTSQAPSTVMNTSDPAGNQGSCAILAGM